MQPNVKTFNERAVPKLKIGTKVEITQEVTIDDTEETEEITLFRGKIFSTNSSHLTLINKNNIKESFKYSDFIESRLKLTQR